MTAQKAKAGSVLLYSYHTVGGIDDGIWEITSNAFDAFIG